MSHDQGLHSHVTAMSHDQGLHSHVTASSSHCSGFSSHGVSPSGLPPQPGFSGFNSGISSAINSGINSGITSSQSGFTPGFTSGIPSSHSHSGLTTGSGTGSSGLTTSCTRTSMLGSVFTDSTNPVHAQIENLLRGSSPKYASGRGSPAKIRNASWRSGSGRNQDSVRSTRSEHSSIRETSFMGGLSEESESGGVSGISGTTPGGIPTPCTVGVISDKTLERTPLELLANSDPGPLVVILSTSIERHRSTMGTRHKCTPSVRLRHCTYHCLQILSARILTVMCHR